MCSSGDLDTREPAQVIVAPRHGDDSTTRDRWETPGRHSVAKCVGDFGRDV